MTTDGERPLDAAAPGSPAFSPTGSGAPRRRIGLRAVRSPTSSDGSQKPTSPSCCEGNEEPESSGWPAPFTPPRAAAIGPSSKLIAPLPSRCSKSNCSAAAAGLPPARDRIARAASSSPTAARSSWNTSARCPRRCRRGSSARLEDGGFPRPGARDEVHADVRVIASSERDLERAVDEGRFREGLFFRLNVVCLTLPPLRQRRTELPSWPRSSSPVRDALQQARAGPVGRDPPPVRQPQLARQPARARSDRQTHRHAGQPGVGRGKTSRGYTRPVAGVVRRRA